MMTARILALTAIALATLVGCTDETGSRDEPKPTPSQVVSASATPAASRGQLIEHDSLSLRLPDGPVWKLLNGDTVAIHRTDEGDKYVVTVNEIPDRDGRTTLDEASARSLAATTLYDPPLTRGENRTVAGVEGWTAETVDAAFGERVYRFGAVHGGHDVYVTILGPEQKAQTREWTEAVLASIEWS